MLTPPTPHTFFFKNLINKQVTTPDDMSIAERFLVERGDVSEKVGAAAAAA